jgi:hypothetical protein
MIASVPSFQLTDERTFFARTASPPSELGELFHNEENEEDKLNALMEMKRSREREEVAASEREPAEGEDHRADAEAARLVEEWVEPEKI